MPAVKIGTSRQVVIPKKIHDEIGLTPGDYLEVELHDGKVVLTPKTLVDKQIKDRLKEGLEDIKRGRIHGPFHSTKDMVRSLRKGKKSKKR
ncbi:MAG TPA: AbrB/MazE/SpoVT family DNA-binding domain-containing protein [Bacteroidota bacterium]